MFNVGVYVEVDEDAPEHFWPEGFSKSSKKINITLNPRCIQYFKGCSNVLGRESNQ